MDVSELLEAQSQGADTTRGIVRWLVQMAVLIVIFAACLFISAGRLGWVWGWVFVGLLAVDKIVTGLVLARCNPELLGERAQSKGPRDLDRVLAGVMAFYGPLATLIVAGLDWRFGWSPQLPVWLHLAGLLVAALGSLLAIWAMASNKHFYGILRIDREKGHAVANSGAYRLVRHPGYLGGILFDLGTPLLLGSPWAFVPALLTVAAIVSRTALEDRALQDRLDGYKDYARQVRFRLLPAIW